MTYRNRAAYRAPVGASEPTNKCKNSIRQFSHVGAYPNPKTSLFNCCIITISVRPFVTPISAGQVNSM